jgi:Lrp/AsnC family transcriptional regulator of lysine biosynthesis
MADETDRKIIELLKQNSRVSNVEIAKAVDLTEGAVRKRIEHLIANKLIKRFTIDVSEEQEMFAVVMVKAKHETKKMMADIAKLKIAKEAYEVSGDYDGCLILSGSDVRQIDYKIDEIRKLKSVSDTKTFISMRKW